jgi:hypothetical protein
VLLLSHPRQDLREAKYYLRLMLESGPERSMVPILLRDDVERELPSLLTQFPIMNAVGNEPEELGEYLANHVRRRADEERKRAPQRGARRKVLRRAGTRKATTRKRKTAAKKKKKAKK